MMIDGTPLVKGDKILVKGMNIEISNPDRRWWQIWKPRMIFLPPTLFEVDVVEETRGIASVQRMDDESHADLSKVLPEVLKSGIANWLFRKR